MSVPPKAPQVYKPTQPRLAAPPVYRPNPIKGPNAQLKPANNFRLETRPAPPVYDPKKTATVAVQSINRTAALINPRMVRSQGPFYTQPSGVRNILIPRIKSGPSVAQRMEASDPSDNNNNNNSASGFALMSNPGEANADDVIPDILKFLMVQILEIAQATPGLAQQVGDRVLTRIGNFLSNLPGPLRLVLLALKQTSARDCGTFTQMSVESGLKHLGSNCNNKNGSLFIGLLRSILLDHFGIDFKGESSLRNYKASESIRQWIAKE